MSDKVLGGDNDLALEVDSIEVVVVVVCLNESVGCIYPPAYSLYDSQKRILER
jgi:hypothetical protein